MGDLLFVAMIVAFFGLAYLLVRACDAIIGPDPAPTADDTSTDETDRPEPIEVLVP